MEKERQMIRAAAEKTAQRIIQPIAAKIDADEKLPRHLVEALGQQGFLSLLLPDAYGGTDGDLTSFCIVIEEIAKVSGSSSLLILAQGMGTLPILLGGSPNPKRSLFHRDLREIQPHRLCAQ